MSISPPRVALRCDSSAYIGTGHVTRCYALAQELVTRGVSIDFVGAVEHVPILTKISNEVRIKPELEIDWSEYSVVVLDSYALEPEYALHIKSFGPQVVVIADDATPPLPADLYIEPGVNLWWQPPLGHEHIRRLKGPEFALIRNELWAQHNIESSPQIEAQLRVLVLLGGSGMSPYLLPLLTALDSLSLSLCVTAVSALPEISQERFHHIQVKTSAPRHDLEILLDATDVVISAAGVTSWEVLSSGKPLGIIGVADNQEPNYVFMCEAAIAVPLGRMYLNESVDLDRLRKLLDGGSCIESMAAHACELVDGKGASRVVDAIMNLDQ